MNQSLLSIFKYKGVFLAGIATGWLEVVIIPKPMLIVCLIGTMVVDLITGLLKSWKKGLATSSSGFRKTVSKIGVYVGVILGMYFLATLLNTMYSQKTFDYSILVNGTISFLVFIELYSIFENIYEIDPDSYLSRKFISRVLKFLKGKMDSDHPLKNIDDGDKQN